jgi:hypothetical protein
MMNRTLAATACIFGMLALPSACRQQAQQPQQSPDQVRLQHAEALYAAPARCDTPSTPFCSSTVQLPQGWTGRVFALSQDYPAAPPADHYPWLAFDPQTQSKQYIQSVLAYFYEGNIRDSVEDSFDPKLNTIRPWYNAPWQDFGFNGREPLHGLTRERTSLPGELHPNQTKLWGNYAVGFYNGAGASAIGRVWADHGKPNPALANMAEGAVGAKLLFTTAGPDQVPYLAGAPTWNADVYSQVNSPTPDGTRAVIPVRLLQIDIAVKDKRAPLGWFFGTFVYGGGPNGPAGSGWTNVAPVGLMWGNDPGYSGTGPLKETWLNKPAVNMPHVGYQGRLNGPVDNPASSCMSCHGTAEYKQGAMIGTPPTDPNFFRDLACTTPFAPNGLALDCSLQVAVGLKNFDTAVSLAQAPTPSARRTMVQQLVQESARPPRDGGTHH